MKPIILRAFILGFGLSMAGLASGGAMAPALGVDHQVFGPAVYSRRSAPVLPTAFAGFRRFGDVAVSPSLRRAIARTLGGGYTQQAELTAPDPSGAGSFGVAVALSTDGTEALVGATDHANYSYVGAVYVFTQSSGIWTQTAELLPSDMQQFSLFGFTVALSSDGKTAVVGAPGYTFDGQFGAGAVYFFTRSGGTWSQTAQFLNPDQYSANEQFGTSVAVSANGLTAIVGADYGYVSYGAAFVYKNSGGTWLQQAELTGPVQGDQFGDSVALSGNGTTALVAANLLEPQTVFVFNESEGAWIQSAELHPPNSETFQDFGSEVALSSDGATALVGANAWPNPQTPTGAAFVFNESGGTWSQLARLDNSDSAVGDDFGVSVAISTDGTTALVGAATRPYPSDIGAAYVFTDSGGAWSQIDELTASDGVDDNIFGSSVALSFDGTTALVGAPGDGRPPSYAGTAYVFTQPLSSACPAGYTEYNGTLAIGERTHSPIYQASAGKENAILTAPSGFRLVAGTEIDGQRKIHRIPGNEVHRWAPAGRYVWIVKAGETGGAYALCILHP